MGNDTVNCETAISLLRNGNAGYAKELTADGVDGNSLATGTMNPFAVVVSCSDMNAIPETVFGCHPGDLAVIRIAGNLVDGVVLGSVILAVRRYSCPVVVVLGHDSCETIRTALSPDAALIREPAPVIKMMERFREDIFDRDEHDIAHQDAVRANVRAGVRCIMDDSFIADRVRGGLLCVLPALYRHETGMVEWL